MNSFARDAVETIEEQTFTAYIEHDEYVPNPRKEWDCFGTMICFHGRYDLGDEHNLGISTDNFSSWDELEEYLVAEEDAAVILPLYLMDHGGISISTRSFNDPWDSGQVGFIFCTREDIRREFNLKRVSPQALEKARRILESEVKVYDQFLRGEVYCVAVVNDKTEEVVDSCCGFFGYDWAEKEAREMLAWAEEAAEKGEL